MRVYRFSFVIECAGQGDPDLQQVESLIDSSMQNLCYDDDFIAALDESQAVTIQVIPDAINKIST